MEIITNISQAIFISLGFLGLYIIVDRTVELIKWLIKYATKQSN